MIWILENQQLDKKQPWWGNTDLGNQRQKLYPLNILLCGLIKTKSFLPTWHSLLPFQNQDNPFQLSGRNFKHFTGCKGKFPCTHETQYLWDFKYFALKGKQDGLGQPMTGAMLVRQKCLVSLEVLWTGNLKTFVLIQIWQSAPCWTMGCETKYWGCDVFFLKVC